MEKNIYAVYDNVTKTYSAPFLEINNGSAIRSIQDLLERDPNNIWSRFPDNYTLMNIGSWNDLEGVPAPDNHAKVAEFVSIKLPKDMEK